MVRKILLLGENSLYERSMPVKQEELPFLVELIGDMEDTLVDFRNRNGWGNSISAIQIGVKKRLIYYFFNNEPVIMINPSLEFIGFEKQIAHDRCLSFPMLGVNTSRYKRCRVKYRDMLWRNCEMLLEGDESARMQHVCDHLDGVLSIARANSSRSIFYRENIADA